MLDETFFDVIDTETKAYALGFITADGSIHKTGFSLSQHERGKHILDSILFAIGIKNPTYWIDENTHIIQTRIPSKVLKERLVSYGVVERKSYNLERITADIPEELMHHFVRGYFDGDGSWTREDVSTKARNMNGKRYHYIRTRAYIRGTIPFLQQLQDVLPVNASIGTYNRCGALYISKKSDVLTFGEWLYEGATLYSNVKYEKFRQAFPVLGATSGDEPL